MLPVAHIVAAGILLGTMAFVPVMFSMAAESGPGIAPILNSAM